MSPGFSEEDHRFLDYHRHTYTLANVHGKTALVLHKPLNGAQQAQAQLLEYVEHINDNEWPFLLASREWKASNTLFRVGATEIGGPAINLVAGPCAVESEEQLDAIAQVLVKLGVKMMRGGAYKPRTSPYSFQGLEHDGLRMLRRVADKYGLAIITEVLDMSYLDEVAAYADILQVGTRNMMNYTFLKALGQIRKPVMLKRGMSAKMEEWLLAAEYVLMGGNEQVILCERGIRSFDSSTRNVLDISAVPLAKELSHLPVFVDPSQGTGKRSLIGPVSKAAIAAGADGLLIEMHQNPEKALSDGPQSLYPEQFAEMIPQFAAVASSVGRSIDAGGFKRKGEQLHLEN